MAQAEKMKTNGWLLSRIRLGEAWGSFKYGFATVSHIPVTCLLDVVQSQPLFPDRCAGKSSPTKAIALRCVLICLTYHSKVTKLFPVKKNITPTGCFDVLIIEYREKTAK
jgi:hypothetical protein